MSYVILYPAERGLFSPVFLGEQRMFSQATGERREARDTRGEEKNNACSSSCRLVILYQILKLKQ